MFIARKKELELIQEKMNSKKFEFGIVYGRRRIGKTRLINEALKDNKGIYFVATEMHYQHNISAFSDRVASHFNEPVSFNNLEDIFKYLVHKSKDERIIIIIDEFTYLLSSEAGVLSLLQNIIDSLSNTNICLILSGSHIGMIEDSLSYKKPLYGRSTFKLKLEAFDYYESAMFYPNYSLEDKVIAYSIFGGIPHYLSLIDSKKSIKENVLDLIISDSGILHDEIDFIIQQELRSISTYKMILDAIASGATRLNEISTKAKVNNTGNTATYLNTLISLELIKKEIPFNDSINSKRTIYKIKDNLVNFTYSFLFRNKSSLNIVSKELFYNEFIEDDLDKYVSFIFEDICKEFLIRNNDGINQEIFLNIGKYWGNNPDIKEEVELDVLTSNKSGITVYECKWTNKIFSTNEIKILKRASSHLNPIKYGAFSYSGFNPIVRKELDYAFTLEDLFR